MQRSETIGKLASALAKAQGEMDNAEKDANNPAFKSADKPRGAKYADLAAVRAAIKDPFSKNGLAYVQMPRFVENCVEVETVIMHGESGEWISETLAVPVGQRTPHAIGSAITYGRRFSLMAIAGIAPEEDDDGNAASEGADKQSARRWEPRRPAPPKAEPPPAQPIDEIPFLSEQQEPNPEASKPNDTPHTGAASVPAANSRKTVNDIPTVAPTRDPVPGRGDFAAPHPESWKERERAQLSKGATEQLLVGEDGNGGLGAIIAGIGISKLAIIEAQFAEWRRRANQGWKRINEADRLRIGNRVAEYNKLVEQERASRDVALGAEKPAISRGDDYDRETGEILEPAE